MIKNLGYKIITTLLTLMLIVIVIAYSPRAYDPSVTATATLDFGSTLPSASTDLTMTVTGAAVGDVIILGVPNASVPANGGFFAWISATNTVSIRFFNNDALASLDPASGSFKSTIIKN